MPLARVCQFSGKKFEISDHEISLREFLGVPLPSLSPSERSRRRLAFRNERSLYRHPCQLCGKPTVTIYSPESPITMYCQECWWSDRWEARSYAQEMDFSRPFFEQVQELMHRVPHVSLWNNQSVNSEWNNCCFYNKNCYMNFNTDNCEDSCYNYLSDGCRDCFDCTSAIGCELCYECVDCENCYGSRFLQNCRNCSDSHFLRNCIGCSNCFGCANLRNKSFCFLNEPCSEEAYSRKIASFDLQSRSGLSLAAEEFERFLLTVPYRYAEILQSENVTGNYIYNSRNARECFDLRDADNARYVTYAFHGIKNVLDGYAVFAAENCYECMSGFTLNDSRFILWINNGPHSSDYCISCVNNCRNLFGCIGLSQAENCILNQEYSTPEYQILRKRLIEHMTDTGEWAEFFPVAMSPFGYNETLAQEYFPTTREEAFSQGWKWRDMDLAAHDGAPSVSIPDSIDSVDDGILKQSIQCERNKKVFRVTKLEFEFYKRQGVPVPVLHPDERHLARLGRRSPRHLWKRTCESCGASLRSPFAPADRKGLLCESCYGRLT